MAEADLNSILGDREAELFAAELKNAHSGPSGASDFIATELNKPETAGVMRANLLLAGEAIMEERMIFAGESSVTNSAGSRTRLQQALINERMRQFGGKTASER